MGIYVCFSVPVYGIQYYLCTYCVCTPNNGWNHLGPYTVWSVWMYSVVIIICYFFCKSLNYMYAFILSHVCAITVFRRSSVHSLVLDFILGKSDSCKLEKISIKQTVESHRIYECTDEIHSHRMTYIIK